MATPTINEGPNHRIQQEPTDRLDPGPPPRPRKKLGFKSTLLSLLGLGAAWLIFKFLRDFAEGVQNPHRKLYQDLNQRYRPQDVVRPLIDGNQTFDVVATVWLRTEQNSSTNSKKVVHQEKWHSVEGGGYTKRITGGIQEKSIFSKTVFTGLTLKDKQLTTSVDFQVPTSIFKEKNLNNYDLRGSFVLVPTSTSLLDHVHSYSSWIPWEAGYPPVRDWTEKPGLSLKDEIVDSYGTFTPLLAFYGIESRCPSSESPSDSEGADEFDEEDVQQEDSAILPPDAQKMRQKWTFTKGKPVLSAHPYIITRSFVSVADMTKVLNRQAYDNVHNRLRIESCGRLGMFKGRRARARWQDCARSFVKTGNQEVRIKLARPTGKNDKYQTEWLYAPYVAVSWTGWGPRDLVAVPVNREICQVQSDINVPAVPDEELEFVNVTWNIAFSGRTPAKFTMVEALNSRPQKYNMTDTELKNMVEQALHESIDGLFGHRHRQAFHPRRKTGLGLIQDIMRYISVVLEVLYWYTRSSTTGISISGTAILASATFLKLVMDTACLAIHNEEHIKLVSFAWKLWTERAIRALLMLKAITRAEIIHWRKTWIPAIHFAPATHSERTSQRIDSRMTFKANAIIYTTLTIFFTTIYWFGSYIILPRGEDDIKKKLVEYLYAFPQCTLLPALVLGRLLQIILNFRSKTFAGMYKATAYIKTVELIFAILSRSPWIVGEALLNAPVTYFDLFELVGCCVLAFQSNKYPAATDLDEEDNLR